MAISADMMSWNFTLQTAKRKVFFSEPDPGFLAADKEILGKSNGKLQITLKKKWFSCKYIYDRGWLKTIYKTKNKGSCLYYHRLLRTWFMI